MDVINISTKELNLYDQSTLSLRNSTKDKKINCEDSPMRSPRSKKKRDSRKSTPTADCGLTSDNPKNLKLSILNTEDKSDAANFLSTTTKLRKDYYGNMITKGRGKKQKVTWIDNTCKAPFPDITQIESFKKYNIDMSEDRVDCNCACLIF